MASFFSKKGPSTVEEERESELKKNLTREFSQALKTLQREHINSAEAIYSDDLANSVCNVLEGVYLHGLKASTAKKITGYLVGSSADSESLNFWQLVKKFTHSDVVSQLNHLGQITSEVGMCRAWVRVALNECLMESYLDAMMADRSTMAYYYKRTAYLRDLEEAGILKSYLQGLGEFQFQLSYNSSVLNAWTTAPLALCGVLEATPTPAAVLAPTADEAVAERLGSVDYGIPAEPEQTSPVVATRSTQRSDRSRKRSSHAIDALRSPVVSPGPPPNSPYDPSLLANRAADELRSKLAGRSSPTHSEASTASSRISCPDPSYMYSEKSSLSGASGEKTVQPSDRLTSDDFVSGKEPSLDTVRGLNETSPHRDISPPIPGLNMGHRKSLPLEPTLTEVVATRIETVHSGVVERSVTLLGVGTRTERANSIRSDYDPMKPEDGADGRRMSVDVLSEADSDQNYLQRVGERSEGGEATETTGGVGNSLGKMSGWSSSFDREEDPPKPSVPVPIERERGFSYGTLLQNYTPSSGGVASSTMQEVLETLGDYGSNQPSSSGQEEQSVEESPACSEFEIISTPVSSDMLYTSSKMYETQILIIGEICNEKGLDMQNYQCRGCARPIGLIYGSPRVCSFDGGYYCYECHENEEYYIPARIVYNWDFRKHKVAKKNREFLQEVEGHPLLNLDVLNPKIYDHVNEMNDLKVLREQLCYVKSYLFTCKQSVAEDLRKSVWPREYLYDQLHLYSLSDLLQVMSGQLATTLRKLVRFATRHIYECRLCSQKGFICEICSSAQVIYPFETESTERCDLCKTVYHRSCKQQLKKCPKCQRRMQRRTRVGGDLITPDSDYSIHPDDQLIAH